MSSIIKKIKSNINENRSLFNSLWKLVLPMAIQNLLASIVNSADIFMLGYVGQDELAAVSLANQYVFILWGFFFGINSAETIMNSQYWGKGDTRTIQAVMGIAFKLSLIVTGVISILCVFAPSSLMSLYTNNDVLIDIGAMYLRIIGVSYLFMSFSQSYQCTLRSVELAKNSTIISTITVFLNVFLNAVFIFGLFGVPKMGVIGVAIATTMARTVELIICVADYIKGTMFKANLKLLLGKHTELVKDFIKYAGPALVNDLSWTLAFSSYSIILGHLNAEIVAASSVSATLRDLFTTVCFGIAGGGAVIIGKELGCNDLERAKKDASAISHVTLAFGIIMGTLIVLLRHPLISFFKLSEVAYGYLNIMMIINGYYLIGQAMNTLMIAGLFRAGGNTKFGMICDTITMWCVSVPLGFLSAFVFKFPPIVVYFILCLDEFWKVPVVYKYYKSYKWVNNITRDDII